MENLPSNDRTMVDGAEISGAATAIAIELTKDDHLEQTYTKGRKNGFLSQLAFYVLTNVSWLTVVILIIYLLSIICQLFESDFSKTPIDFIVNISVPFNTTRNSIY